jgi:acyl carrier protein
MKFGLPANEEISQMPMSETEVFEKVKETLVDALGVDDNEVTPQATLTGDLGAESIDFLDIVFRLEKAFSIKIPRGELFPDNILNNPEFVQNGRLTPAGLTQLKKGMPHADFSEFEKDPNVSKMAELFKVQTIVNYIKTKVA